MPGRGAPGPGEQLRVLRCGLARDRADDQQQDDRTADRDQPGAEVEEVVDLANVEGARDEAADQGAEDADCGGADAVPAKSPRMIQARIPI